MQTGRPAGRRKISPQKHYRRGHRCTPIYRQDIHFWQSRQQLRRQIGGNICRDPVAYFCPAVPWHPLQLEQLHSWSAVGFRFSAYGVVQSQRVSRLVVRGLGLSFLHHSPPALRILQHGAGAKHIPIEGLVVMIGLKDRGLQQSHGLVALLSYTSWPLWPSLATSKPTREMAGTKFLTRDIS